MSDVMRQQYRELSPLEKAQIQEIKQAGEQFCNLCDSIRRQSPNPERDAYIFQGQLRMQEAVMWATKGVTA